jgi:hypothetical protein
MLRCSNMSFFALTSSDYYGTVRITIDIDRCAHHIESW